MGDKTPEQVPEACAKLYQGGLAALEKNEAASAISSFMTALEMEPGFVACRQALRQAQKKAAEQKPGFWTRLVQKGRRSPSLSEAEVLLHLQPLKTIALGERVLNQDPDNVTAHKLLAKAALAADLPRTALLSLEALAQEHPEHRAIKLELAEALAKSGDASAAAAIYGQLLKDDPQDGAVLRGLQAMSNPPVKAAAPLPVNGHAAQSPAGPTPSPAFQRQPEAVPGTTADDATIKRFEALLVHGPKNRKFLTTLAEAYARKGMFDKSLTFYEQALNVVGGKHPGLEKTIAETTQKKFDQELSRLDPRADDYAAQCERIQNQRLELQWHEMEGAH
jgi:tetratricopeptide (TPR) repeat protein